MAYLKLKSNLQFILLVKIIYPAIKASLDFFTNFLQQATNLEENQNNEEGQPKDLPSSEVNETSETVLPPTAATPEIKETPTAITQPETRNDKQETETMEVHKHPHHVMHKKKWHEYLLEFFMIFFAVAMGFFAENIREKISEHKHEKLYARRLLEDLKADTTFYRKQKQRILKMQPGFDRLFQLLTTKEPSPNKDILEEFLPLGYTFKMTPTSTTYNEMKSSGTLRYIENEELVKAIQAYYELSVSNATQFAENNTQYFNQYVVPFYNNNIRAQDWNFRTDSLITDDPVILERNSKLDQQLANIMNSYGHLLEAYVRIRLSPAEEQAVKVIAAIEKEYKIE